MALVLLMGLSTASPAQDIRYITDELFVPVRSGQGTQYRIVHRGLPSGTRVTVRETDEESGYSYVITDGGTEGWLLSRYLESERPAEDRLAELQTKYDAMLGDEDSVRSQLVEARSQSQALSQELEGLRSELEDTRSELAEVRRISSNALALDEMNRRLAEESEFLKTRVEVLEADNQRMEDSRESQAFRNGALAVLLGVIITLLVPRLWPKRRRTSEWA
jgi:SH3 domain protein